LLAACGSQGAAAPKIVESAAPSTGVSDAPSTSAAAAPTASPTPAPKPLQLAVADTLTITDTDTAILQGTTQAGATITWSWSDKPETSLIAGSDGKFIIKVSGLPLGDTKIYVQASLAGYSDKAASVSVTEIISPARAKALYIAGAQTIPYVQLKKDPASLVGTKVTYVGQVFQFDSNTGTSHLMVSVTQGAFNLWDDHVWLDLDDPAVAANVYEKSIIRFWGEVVGPYSYTTVNNGQLIIPEIHVVYLET
jgi:hypothetical protein